MVQKNEMFEKKLKKNYGTVQEKEIYIADNNLKLAKEFSTSTVNFSKTLKQEMNEHITQDKDVKNTFVSNIKELKTKYASHLKDLETQDKNFQEGYKKDLAKNLEKYEAENIKLNDLVVALNNDNEKAIKDMLLQYEKDVENSELEKVKISESAEKDIKNLLSVLKDAQDKYESLVVNLNDKNTAKLEKLNVTANKKIEKLTSENEKEQVKTEKVINDFKPTFEENLKNIDEKLSSEKEKYQKREGAIKSTLDSKVARHEKFMKKSQKDNDQRAVKQHKKEITVLEKNAEREIKILAKEHNDKYGVLSNKKKKMITANITKLAVLQTELVKFKEEKLYQIELCKVTLKDDLEITTLIIKQQLEDELNKYNEFYADNERKQAEITKIKEINIEKQVDLQVNLKALFDKSNQINEVKHQEGLSIKEKEIKNTEIIKSSEEVLAKLSLDVELAKKNNERAIAEKELVQSTKLLEENSYIGYQNNDFNKQASINNEYLKYQKELSNLYVNRANSVLEYEELELSNRSSLKTAFLEEQKLALSDDLKNVVNKINSVFESEKAMFETEINKFAKKALENLSSYELEANEKINVIIEKKKALDPRAYKKEIKALDKDIMDKKSNLKTELAKRNNAINIKTGLYKRGLEEAEVRKGKALKEVEALNNNEQTRLDNAIELLKKEMHDESINAKERLSSTVTDSNNFSAQADERQKTVIEENTNYRNSRIEKEEIAIKEIKKLFEQEKHLLTNELEKALVDLGKLKNENVEETKKQKLKEEELLENKVKGYDNQIANHNQLFEKRNIDQKEVYRLNASRIDKKHNNHLVEISKELNVKVENYKGKTVDIDRATSNEQKGFDIAKKQIQKDYEIALSKGVLIINQKLQQDLKNI